MKNGILIRRLSAAVVLLAAALPQSVLACAACFGRSDSPMAKGMNMGILTLLLVVMSVLMAIAAFFIFLMVRAARLSAANQTPAASLSEISQPTP